MIQLCKLFLWFLPTLLFLSFGQMAQPRQEFLTVVFAIVSALLCFTKIENYPQSYLVLQKDYTKGMVCMAIFILICATFPVGGYLGRPLMSEHSSENAQAIVVLASGGTPTGEPGLSGMQRVTHGIELLKHGRAPLLVVSTGYSKKTGHAESAWVASYTDLFALNPASLTILISEEIVTTATEAAYARKRLEKLGINRILLVTSNAHIYRSCRTFSKAGFEVLPAPTHNAKNIFYASEHYLTSLNAVIHEWVGLLYYYLRDRI